MQKRSKEKYGSGSTIQKISSKTNFEIHKNNKNCQMTSRFLNVNIFSHSVAGISR